MRVLAHSRCRRDAPRYRPRRAVRLRTTLMGIFRLDDLAGVFITFDMCTWTIGTLSRSTRALAAAMGLVQRYPGAVARRMPNSREPGGGGPSRLAVPPSRLEGAEDRIDDASGVSWLRRRRSRRGGSSTEPGHVVTVSGLSAPPSLNFLAGQALHRIEGAGGGDEGRGVDRYRGRIVGGREVEARLAIAEGEAHAHGDRPIRTPSSSRKSSPSKTSCGMARMASRIRRSERSCSFVIAALTTTRRCSVASSPRRRCDKGGCHSAWMSPSCSAASRTLERMRRSFRDRGCWW